MTDTFQVADDPFRFWATVLAAVRRQSLRCGLFGNKKKRNEA